MLLLSGDCKQNMNQSDNVSFAREFIVDSDNVSFAREFIVDSENV